MNTWTKAVMRAPILARREEIESLIGRAEAALDQLLDHKRSQFGPDSEERETRVRNAIEALRLGVIAAGFLGDPSLAALVASTISGTLCFNEHPEDHITAAGNGLTRLLRSGAVADEHVAALAGNKDSRIRLAVAKGLRPTGAAETELLDLLAADVDPDVRRVAKKALAEVREIPWWAGKFKQDPARHLPPGDAAKYKAPLDRLTSLLDTSPAKLVSDQEHRDAVLAAIAELPDALAVEVVEQVCSSLDYSTLKQACPLLSHVLSREGGVAAFAQLVESRGVDPLVSRLAEGYLTAAAQAAPLEARRALCLALMARAERASIEERTTAPPGAATLAAEIAGGAWPPDDDVTPVLDVILRMEELPERRVYDPVQSGLARVLSRPGAGAKAVIDRAIDARLAGYPGPWHGIGSSADVLLSTASPEILRGVAERALATDDKGTIAWGLEQLLGPLYDSAKDGPPLERARALRDDPKLKAAMMSRTTLESRTVVLQREDLRAGRLDYPAAAAAIEAIGRLYGGVVPRGLSRAQEEDLGMPEVEIAPPKELEPWLGPEEMRGPPTEEEWARLKEARAGYTPKSARERAYLWHRSLSDGPFTEEERSEFFDLLRSLREGDEKRIAYFLAHTLASKPAPELFSTYDEILALSDAEERPNYERMRDAARQWLGLNEKGSGAGPEEDAEPDDWED